MLHVQRDLSQVITFFEIQQKKFQKIKLEKLNKQQKTNLNSFFLKFQKIV